MYETGILSLNKLTPHQSDRLAILRERFNFKNRLLKRRIVHLRAPAGTGKTFVAIHFMLDILLHGQVGVPADAHILFITESLPLCYAVAKELEQRAMEHPLGVRYCERILDRLHILFEPWVTLHKYIMMLGMACFIWQKSKMGQKCMKLFL